MSGGDTAGRAAPWSPAALRQQWAQTWPVHLLCLGTALVAASAVYGISVGTGTPLIVLTRDPVSSFEVPAYVGLLSSMGGLLWAATAAVCLFAAGRSSVPALSRFLRWAGLLTALLCLDDTYLLHEDVFPAMLPVRGVEYMVYAAYALFLATFVLYYARLILKTEFLLFAAALACGAISVLMDKALPYRASDGSVIQVNTYVEDCFKFLGIVLWLGYFVRVARRAMTGPGLETSAV